MKNLRTLTTLPLLLTATTTILDPPAVRAAPVAGHSYEISLDSVLLADEWGAPGELIAPTHGILALRVLRGDQVLERRLLGRGPEDANVATWSHPSLLGDGDGVVGYLIAGVPHRPDPWSFTASEVFVPADARLEIGVILARRTWFTEQRFETTKGDQALIATFSTGLGTVLGGLSGLLVAGIAEGLFGWMIEATTPDDVPVPCWGLMRADLVGFEAADLSGDDRVTVEPTGTPQWFGCPRPHIGYQLSVRRTSFDAPQITPGPCRLEPVRSVNPRFVPRLFVDAGVTTVARLVTELRQGDLAGSWAVDSRRTLGAGELRRGAGGIPWALREATPFVRDLMAEDLRHTGPYAHAPGCTTLTNVKPSKWVSGSRWFAPLAPLAPSSPGLLGALKDALHYEEALTWSLTPDVTLQLYAETQGDAVLGYRLRYLRRDAQGQVVDDVLLVPGYELPR